jgi:predicted enzyme related to lactoylglutathione lyase
MRFKITADNPARAMDFFEDIFGWKFNKMAGPVDYYLIATGPDSEYGINGGMEPRVSGKPTMPNCTVIEVDSIDTALEKIVAKGGVVTIPKFEIPGVGYSAYFTDTEGNWFGMVQHTGNEIPSGTA